MIIYPTFKQGDTIGVTAPSSGVEAELHELVKQASARFIEKGHPVVYGDTVWTQNKAKSAPAKVRAKEFMNMMADDHIDIIIPPWGGELLVEILEHIDFSKLPSKWVLGYSDISLLLLAITINTGIATAHGTNLVDLRGEYSDETTAKWQTVLSTEEGKENIQFSSEKFQKAWNHEQPSPCVFHLTEPTNWKTIADENVTISGRLLGGCLDVIRHLIGTPYGEIEKFRNECIPGEQVVWYLENCEMNTADLRRSLVQMKYAGWFDNCAGILFGRSSANIPVENYIAKDVYQDLFDELKIPIVYDIDCGHVPPQITFINGAFAEIEVENGKGTVRQFFI
ncbi:LD-carboxypeptidase [Caldibacillus lycopersici]|uniref:LD-carboxypeptidase n=1 Tax=Perspicuibacillus lycopersici TaxID=1325689 RepID=A0AAE3IT08_9BACI|nr:S66 peptidase family protein [Perspicuibacillus lycopersici]MCU9612906.1 LD-carboxypeptidase [Perspicuibacillus lycopersici]